MVSGALGMAMFAALSGLIEAAVEPPVEGRLTFSEELFRLIALMQM